MTPSQTRLLAGVAAAVLLAGAGGYGLARLTQAPASPAAEEHGEEHEGAEGGVVPMQPDIVRASGITVEQVRAGGLASEILASATASPAPGGEASISAGVSGRVVRINARLGDPVRAGQVLATIESRDAAQIAADRAAANARAQLARRTLARERALNAQGVTPRMDLERAQAEAAAADAEVRRAQAAASAANVSADGRSVVVISPISGRVTASAIELGAFVEPAVTLYHVADTSRVHVEVALPATDAARVAPGDRAVVDFDGRSVEATVRSVTPGVDAISRTATAILDVGGLSLQPGQTGRVRLFPRSPGGATTIVVPDEAIQSVEGRDVVFVRTPTGFRAQPVVRGQTSAGRTEIVSGLRAGQSIATRNTFLLKAELGKGEGDEH